MFDERAARPTNRSCRPGWTARNPPQTPSIVLDLEEVELVDADVVRFLSACESKGIHLQHCSAYIREWIVRERESAIKG
jgi:hypothetical protein